MKSYKTYHIAAILCFIQISNAEQLHVQEFCGIEVGPKIGALVKQISAEYHQQVMCVEKYMPGANGLAVASDGKLEVVISPDKGKNPLTIAHELLHLQLGAEGFLANPQVTFYPPPPGIGFSRVKQFQVLMYDELQHRILFPRFPALGFPNGDSDFAQKIAAGIEHNDPPKDLPEFESINLMRLHNAHKTAELNAYRIYLRQHGRAPQVALGDWLIANAEKNDPRTTKAGLAFMYEATRKAYSQPEYYSVTGPFL